MPTLIHRVTFERVRELFDYDPLSGLLTWRIRSAQRVHIGDVAGTKNSRGYIQVSVNGRLYNAHRIIFLWMTGQWPRNDIDHINLNKSDNRWLNLRAATRSQNRGNTPVTKKNKCGLKGVCQCPSGRWVAQICVNGNQIYIGTFDTPEQAHAAYAETAKRYHGEFARAA